MLQGVGWSRRGRCTRKLFDAAAGAAKTAASKAAGLVEKGPAMVQCTNCNRETPDTGLLFRACSHCGAPLQNPPVQKGKELPKQIILLPKDVQRGWKAFKMPDGRIFGARLPADAQPGMQLLMAVRVKGAGDILFSLANDCPEDLLFGDSKELDKEPMEFARIVSAVASGKGGGKGKGNPAPGQVPPGQMPGYGQAPNYGCPPGPLPGYGQMPQTQMPGAGQVPYAQMPPPGHMPHMPPGIIQPAYTKAAANPPFVDESTAGSRMPNLPPAGASTPTPASAQANFGMPNVTGLMDMAGKGVKSLWQQGADSTTKP